MVTVVLPGGAGVGAADGPEGALYPLHAAKPIDMLRSAAKRRDIPRTSCDIGRATGMVDIEEHRHGALPVRYAGPMPNVDTCGNRERVANIPDVLHPFLRSNDS
jgi:hypothetical protein